MSAALSALALSGCGSVPAKASPDDPAGNFSQVTPNLYRGGRPDEPGVQALVKLGVKTIIDLENDDKAVDQERAWAASAGLNFIHFPMNGLERPRDGEVNDIQSKINDPQLQPVYVHCMEGVDRTGLIIAIHRVESEAWTPKDAYDEMIALGFKKILLAMKDYYEDRTGYDG